MYREKDVTGLSWERGNWQYLNYVLNFPHHVLLHIKHRRCPFEGNVDGFEIGGLGSLGTEEPQVPRVSSLFGYECTSEDGHWGHRTAIFLSLQNMNLHKETKEVEEKRKQWGLSQIPSLLCHVKHTGNTRGLLTWNSTLSHWILRFLGLQH